MSIDRGVIERMAELARLRLTDDELDGLTEECRQILRHFESVRDADEGEPPPNHRTGPEGAALRPDAVRPDPLGDRPARLAPAWQDGFFVLPRLPALDESDVDPPAPEPDEFP